MGGINVSNHKHNLTGFNNNPALLDSVIQKEISLNYSNYMAGVQLININYAWKPHWAVGFQTLQYGDFIGRDASSINVNNNFSAADYNIYLSNARKINNISFGISAKLVGSYIESYNSIAIMSDWGGVFQHPKKDFTIGLVAKNIGVVLKSYGTIKPEIPFDLQAGITFKPQFMPIRFSITAHHLHQLEINSSFLNSTYKFDTNGNKIIVPTPITEKIMRHFVIGIEILAASKLSLLMGYNHLRRQELAVQNFKGLSGLSFGFHLKYKPFELYFSHAYFVSHKGLTAIALHW